jgi:hypothetical protein
LPTFEWSEPLYTKWLSRFEPAKQQRMMAALATLDTATLKQYKDKELMCKVEALLVEHKPNWAPRVIYKGSDLYNAVAGPMYWELMHRLDQAAENRAGPHKVRFSYGRTPEQ